MTNAAAAVGVHTLTVNDQVTVNCLSQISVAALVICLLRIKEDKVDWQNNIHCVQKKNTQLCFRL